MKTMNLKTKLITGFLVVGILPALTATAIAWWNGTQLITAEMEKNLTAIRDIQKTRLDDLLNEVSALTKSTAESTEVQAALTAFRPAFETLPEQLTKNKNLGSQAIIQHVKAYYAKDWSAQYQDLHKTSPSLLDAYIDVFEEKTFAAQYSYASANPETKKGDLQAADDDTDYTKVHRRYHKSLKGLADAFKMDDIILVDATSGYVLWTAHKELDFGTNIKHGPLADTVQGKAFKAAVAEPNKSHVTDMEKFFPSLDKPSLFTSAAIKINGRVEGVIIFQIPFDRIDLVTNLDRKWKERGLGVTGEMFIIGKDQIMRSSMRGILESKADFIADTRKAGVDENSVKWMENVGTSANTFAIKSKLSDRAILGETAIANGRDYRGKDVIMAFAPLDGFSSWFLMVKMDTDEGLAGVQTLRNILFVLVAIAATLVLFVAWTLGSSLSKSIAAIATRLGSGSVQVAEASQEIAAGATELSESATEQAASLQETSAAIDEISAMVNRSAENAEQSRQRARSSQQRIQEGKHAINDMVQAMSSINNSNEKIVKQVANNAQEFESVVKIISEIGNRTKVINDIVFQTKLLSFNASVEAARAGEHGKGFAVVAEEVGNLAQMSGNAAKEISTMLEESIKRVTSISNESKRSVEQLIETGKSALDNGNEKARSCDRIFDEIMQDSSAVTSIVEEIATSAREQATGIQEVTKAMGQLDEATQQNTAVSQQSSAAAEQLSTQSNELHQMVVNLEAIVHGRGKATTQAAVEKQPKKLTSHKAESTSVKTTSNQNVVPMKTKQDLAATTRISSHTMKKAVGSDIVPSENDPRFEEV